jgi:23S rRNA (cytosine1962-C5)-methyltransferase
MIEAAEARRHDVDDTKRGWEGKPRRTPRAQRGFGKERGVGQDAVMDWIRGEMWDRLGQERTDAHRVATGRDGYLDRYGDWILWSGEAAPRGGELAQELADRYGFVPQGYLARDLVRRATEQKPARVIEGKDPGVIAVAEGGVRYLVEPAGGYSSGLFLDQRMNRAWVCGLAPRRMLNLFAYTGSFTVCAALTGAQTCSVDVSKRALARARENLERNEIEAAQGHRWLADDAMKVVPRLAKRQEKFDLIVLDPPTFGRADGKVFRLERDLPALVEGCWTLLERGGFLLVACNYAEWDSGDLRAVLRKALNGADAVWSEGELPPEIPRGAVSWRIGKV